MVLIRDLRFHNLTIGPFPARFNAGMPFLAVPVLVPGFFLMLNQSTVVPGCNVNGYNPHIMDKILWSQIFSGFYNVDFPLYNGL